MCSDLGVRKRWQGSWLMWSSGLDASIGFESERAENIGKHFINDTLTFVSICSIPNVTL
jgi:hypothetical protein